MTAVEFVYLICGFILPLFYLPQILRLHTDTSNLSSYSLSKAAIQGTLRLPALAFGMQIGSMLFVVCVLMDLAGRLCEIAFAVQALRRQGNSLRQIAARLHPMAKHHPAVEFVEPDNVAVQPPQPPLNNPHPVRGVRRRRRRRKTKGQLSP